ncbi:FdrA family protein [Cellulomonas wangsupingiae]|uniref:FdrA family protein n=1 Tax=Cellulomonas wangsupingiae TaxID=2968085 RepID=A0ABY5K8Y4_9CELL|nr:FdrA family protein [Cellulomonas wangsupingiae]MCC2335342.1 FdrA family protein [Cellulomonas wangsupingiae]UUI66523.1 FdrA family protein [Cellulomonas wangsupingiae]
MTTTSAGALAARVLPRLYRDSVTLMALASSLERRAGVTRAGAVMGTPGNLTVLERSGMRPVGLAPAPDDLVLVVRGLDEDVVAAALDAGEAGLVAVEPERGGRRRPVPQTVGEGRAADPGATLAVVSTPGTYAPVVVEQALRAGLHVLCFSDNVTTADEVRLKALAVRRRLLLMGPDCGTAILDGVPLGFANAVRRGPVGIVAASGTGAQEVSCLLHRAGTGVSQLVGVGGRDLSAEVGGTMTDLALDLLSTDDTTAVVVVVSKPPAAQVAQRLLARLAGLGKPAVACLLGQDDTDGAVPVRGTLEGGARLAATLVGAPLHVGAVVPPPAPAARGVLGLYTGGTLAAETRVVLARAGVDAQVLDLGADEYTVGRPHPMIDPSARAERVAAAGGRADVGVLLVDLVLGFGAAADPATPLARAAGTAVAAARADGRDLVVLASVCGTDGDPQGLDAARRTLEGAGVLVHPSNAAAARTAVALVAGGGVPA